MYTVAYKWRLTTNKYAYITSTEYRKDNSDPNFTLSIIGEKLPSNDEYIIKEKVRLMSADEYRQCFEYMQTKIALDPDGQYIKLKNWEYYYHFNNDENGDNDFLVIEATATAKKSEDGNARASVVNENGVLNFSFEIPYGLDGKDGADGKDGLKGEPGEDSKTSESIYKITKNNSYDRFFPETWFNEIDYQKDDYVPTQHGWSDRPSGITSDYRYEWVSTRKYNTSTKLWEEFSKPVLMSRWGEDGKDGDGIEYVYKGTNDEKAPLLTIPENYINDEEYQKDDFIPNGWLDTPEGVNNMGKKYAWVSQRKEKDGIWGPFSYPALWSKWGEDGNGVEYVYFVTNSDIAPEIDEYDVNSDEYQNTEFLPSTEGEKWSDEYVEPTVTNHFSWFSMRKYKNGAWEAFSEPKIWNTYKISGKFIVELFTRSNNVLDYYDLPYYDNEIYYSFVENKFFSDKDKTNVLDNITSFNKNVTWETGIPIEASKKYLYKTSAIVDVQKDYDELMQITSDKWCGPFIVATNGENAINNAPYVIFDDSSLSLPIKKEDNHPHEAYYYSFNAKLYFSDTQMEILNVSTKVNTSKIKNLTTKISKTDINTKVNECNISFNIDNSQEFTTIETIYVTLNGTHEGKPVEGTGQFKIIPFMSEDAILYRILLSDKVIFIPSDTCSDDSGLGPWHINLSGAVVDNRGNTITLTDESVLNYKNKSGEYINLKDGLTLYNCDENIDYDTKGWVKISDLPNPLAISYTVWGKVRETEYVHFINMPVDGIDGISSRMVFAYTSTNENEIPSTPSGGSVNFTDNTIEYPKSYDENGNETYVWGSNINLSGVVWLTQCEFFSDGTSDLVWSTPVRLTGFKGVNSVHLELSNDMDQVYTTDGEVKIPNQKVETIVTLMSGGEKLLLPESGVTATGNDYVCTCTKVDDYSVKVSCVLTAKTINESVKHNDITILVDGDVYGNSNIDLSKTFKIAVLNGTLDFDLDVSHTVIKRNKLGNYSTDEIAVYVTKRDIATDAKQVDRISVDTFSEYGLEVVYYFNNDNNSTNPLTSNNISIPNNNIEKLTLLLYRHKQLIDSATVDCVFDGIDGSAYHLELSNEMDQVYVTDNKILISGQTILSTINLYNNTIGADNDIINIGFEDKHSGICTSNITSNKKGDVITSHTMSITFLTGKTVNDDVINFKITATTKNETTISREFKVIKLNGSKDYDLIVTPTYVKADKNGNLTSDNVSIKIIESDISTNERVVKELVTLPTNISLYRKINGGTEQKITNYNSGTTVNIDNTFEKIEIILKKSDGGITKDVDYVKVEKISDGADGLNGSAYNIDLSNDLDQVYVVDNIVKHKQTIKTTVFLYDGINKVDPSECKYEVNNNLVNNIVYNNSGVTLTFEYDENTTITADTINHEIKVIYKDKTFVKTFKLVKLNGTIDYDLLVNPTIIKKDKQGIYTPSTIEVKVNKTDISTVDRTITELKDFENDNFKIKIDTVGNSITNTTPSFNISSSTINKYATIELLSGTTLLDYCHVEVVSDGIDGVSGDTPCHIEMSNDMDQVLTVDNRVVKDDQTITTDISVYRGTNLITSLTKDDVKVTYDDKLWSITPSAENGIIKYSITPINGVELKNREYDFSFTVNGDVIGTSHSLVKKFKVIRIDGTKDYDLYANHTIVKKSLSGYSVSSVTIEVKETDFSSLDTKVTTVSSLNELKLNLLVKIDGNTITRYTYDSGVTFDLSVFKPAEKIYLELSKNGVLIDYINIEIVSDGKNGEDGVDGSDIQFIYCLGKDEKDLNSIQNGFKQYYGSSKEDILNVTGNTPWWTDSPSGISENYKIEVCSQRTKNAGSESWSNWCPPFIWAKWGDDGIDGDGVEYLFQITSKDNNEVLNPGNVLNEIRNGLDSNEKVIFDEIINLPDFVPGDEWIKNYTATTENEKYIQIALKLDLNWYDNPFDVGPYEPIEYVSIRKKTVKEDGSFIYTYTDPKVWAEWKRDVYDSITEFIFAVDSRDLSNCTINGGTWESLKNKKTNEIDFVKTLSGSTELDVTWYDSIPAHNNINQFIWMVKGFASGEITYTGETKNNNTGIEYKPINWTSPTKLMESQSMQVEYSCIDNNGVIPNPIQLEDVKKQINEPNFDLTELENKFRELDASNGRYNWEWKNSSELSGQTPIWMITSTLNNGEWSDWVVSRIKGEQGEKGETGQSIQIKGSFDTLQEIKNAYNYFKNGGTKPSKYFVDDKLIIGDSYIVNESVVNNETVYGYLYVYVRNDADFNKAWEAVGQIKGMDGKDGVSSYIYIVYANELIDKKYILTSGGTYEGKTYFGTTPGKYIGIHIATQQYEGHPYPPKLYSASAITNTDKTFSWNKWEGDDGFGQEQIFILSGETAPTIPTIENTAKENGNKYTIEEWNEYDFVPHGWSDKPLTTNENEECCWMAVRRFPYKGDSVNEFKGDNNKAILFSRYSKNGEDGNGIKLIEEFYLSSNSNSGVTTGTTGWTNTVVTTDKNNRYLWNYEKITYTNNNYHSTTPQVIGMYSEDGVGIKNIKEYYQISDSNTNAPTTWDEVAPTLTNEKKYLWNYEKITYSNDQTGKTAPVVIGVYGDKGLDGSSPFHVELNNDFDLVSVLNNRVNGDQTIKIEARLYEGNTPRDITSIRINNSGNIEYSTSEKLNDIGVKFYEIVFTIPNGIEFNGIRNIVIKVNDKYDTYLTLKPLETTILYQLVTDKGFVTKGSNSTITATVMSKTNSGLLPINDNLPSGMTIEVYEDTTNELLTSGTSSSLTYNYKGDENFNEIDFRLKLNGELYDNVNVEVKNKIKGFGNLDLTPLELIIYIDNNNKPLITSTTLNGSFIYDGKNIGLQNSGLTITSTTDDFSINVKANDSLELIFNSDATICGNTKESYTINCEYEGCEYDKNIYINYVKSDLTVNALYDTLYIPYDITSQYYTIELNTDVSYNGVYVTNECILSSETGITFNQRGGKWCINIPSKYYDNTGLTISYNYNNIIANKEYTIVRRGDYNSFFINAYPQRINGDATIEVYITKNSYDGEYVSMDENNLKLKYIIDNEQEQDYDIENAPKEHGNIAFYPNGKIYIKNDVSYTQEPIYNRIQFNLYGADNKLKASEIIERVDIIGDYEIKHITSSGLYIDPKDIFQDFNVDDYDIIVKEL